MALYHKMLGLTTALPRHPHDLCALKMKFWAAPSQKPGAYPIAGGLYDKTRQITVYTKNPVFPMLCGFV